MTTVLNYSPGQQATIVFQTLNALGERSDGYNDGYGMPSGPLPQITRIIFPNLSLAAGYPQYFTRLDVGLFMAQFTLPIGASAVGTYIVDILFNNPDTGLYENDLVQVLVSAPFGNFSVSTF
jgi:hypothetical protein